MTFHSWRDIHFRSYVMSLIMMDFYMQNDLSVGSVDLAMDGWGMLYLDVVLGLLQLRNKQANRKDLATAFYSRPIPNPKQLHILYKRICLFDIHWKTPQLTSNSSPTQECSVVVLSAVILKFFWFYIVSSFFAIALRIRGIKSHKKPSVVSQKTHHLISSNDQMSTQTHTPNAHKWDLTQPRITCLAT